MLEMPTRRRFAGIAPSGAAGIGLAAAVVLWFGVRAWAWRWIGDDGIIVHRTVRNLLAGNGPVFNVGERVEANTSVLWTYLVAAGGAFSDDLDLVSIVLGIALTLTGLAAMLAGCAALYGRATARLFLPVGVAVYCALPAARDFASSGLENGLVLAWVGAVWWLLCRWASDKTAHGGIAVTALVVGLGPLVRPEAAVVTAVAGLYLLLSARTNSTRLRIVAWAAALPVAYQVFRMGYYGLPLPHTAMAKEAGANRWDQGVFYWSHSLRLFNVGWVWVGVALVVVGAIATLVVSLRTTRSRTEARARFPIAPIGVVLLSALILIAYSLYNGGDYMRGRMTLFPLALMLAPVAWVPVPRMSPDAALSRRAPTWPVTAGMIVLLLWSVSAVIAAPNPDVADTGEVRGIVDERAYKVAFTGTATPDDTDDYARIEEAPALASALDSVPRGAVLMARRDNLTWITVSPTSDGTTTVVAHHLGIDAALAPLEVRVWDYVGLATPIAGHITGIQGGRIGHDKDMPIAWAVAASTHIRPDEQLPPELDGAHVEAARAALACTEVRKLLEPASAPLTLSRFLSNIAGALDKYSTRIPSDPVAAARSCH